MINEGKQVFTIKNTIFFFNVVNERKLVKSKSTSSWSNKEKHKVIKVIRVSKL